MFEKSKISIICVYNNKKILEENLIVSLNKQTLKYELILIDNTNNRFMSVASGMNFGAKQANGEYLIFVHQDVMLIGDKWLENVVPILDQLELLGLAGIAGMSENGKTNKDRGRGDVINHRNGDERWCWGNKIQKPEIVQTLDEFLLIIPRQVFTRLTFDDITCPRWELFGVDYSLSVKEMGLFVYVIPMDVAHNSAGRKISRPYFMALRRIFQKHRSKYAKIYTTCGDWDSRLPIYLQRVYQIWKWLYQVKITKKYNYRN